MAIEPEARRRAHQWRQELYERTPEREALFETLSGHPIEPLYTEEDLEGFDPAEKLGHPGEHPFTRGIYPSMYRGRLWTMRQFAGFGTVEETNERFRYLLDARPARALDRVRHADPDGPRLRPRPLARRGRGGGGGARHRRRHGDPVRLDPARPGDRLDDDQRPGGDPARLLRRRRGGEGDRGRAARRHDPDRHPQGVHRPEGVVLPDRSGDAAGHRHGRVVLARDAALAPDLDLRLPHPRGRLDRPAGARVHAQGRLHLRRAGDRARPRRRRLRAPPVVLLQRPHRLLRGDRQVPRGAADLGAGDARHLRRPRRALADDALPHPDRRASR